jgi:uncharacterized protein (TIGR02118 family)
VFRILRSALANIDNYSIKALPILGKNFRLHVSLSINKFFNLETSMPKTFAKRIGFLQKRADLTPEQFAAHWRGVHAVLCQRIPGLQRYVINIIDRERFPTVPYDGFSELWFESEEAHDAAFKSPEGVELLADIPNFVEKLTGVMVKEERFIWPAGE